MRWFALVFMVGCSTQWTGWDDVPTARVTPASDDPAFSAGWAEKVALDVATWNAAVGDCAPPFEIAEDGRPIILVAFDTWPSSSNIHGMTDDDKIRVRSGSYPGRMMDHPALLLHELGHALGLGHADPKYGPSVMTPFPFLIDLQPRDVAAAACVMGCGPCDQPDHFDSE